MKKFLTMLLALSVVFTYTFGAAGSVFAAKATTEYTLSEAKTLLQNAMQNAKADAYDVDYSEDHDNETAATADFTSWEISADFMANGIQAGYNAILTEINGAADTVTGGEALVDKVVFARKDADAGLLVTAVKVGSTKVAFTGNATQDNATVAAALEAYATGTGLADAEEAAFDEFKAYLLKLVDKVDLSIYTDTMYYDNGDERYQSVDQKYYDTSIDAANADIAYAKAVINNAKFDATVPSSETANNASAWKVKSYKDLYSAIFDGASPYAGVIKTTAEEDEIDNTKHTGLAYKLINKYSTKATESGAAATVAAAISTAKARLAQIVADYQATNDYKSTQDAEIAAYVEAQTYVIENTKKIGANTLVQTINSLLTLSDARRVYNNGILNASIAKADTATTRESTFTARCAEVDKYLADMDAAKTNYTTMGYAWDADAAADATKATLVNIYNGANAAPTVDATYLTSNDIISTNLTAGQKASTKIDLSEVKAGKQTVKVGVTADVYQLPVTLTATDSKKTATIRKTNGSIFFEKQWNEVKVAVDAFNNAVDTAVTGLDVAKAAYTLHTAIKDIEAADIYNEVAKNTNLTSLTKYAGLTYDKANNGKVAEDIFVTFNEEVAITDTNGTGLTAANVNLWYIAQGAATKAEANAMYADACKVIDAFKTLATIKSEAAAVTAKIATLADKASAVKLENKAAIVEAYDAYHALAADAQKYVTNTNRLDINVAELQDLEEYDLKVKASVLPTTSAAKVSDKEAIKAFKAAFDAYKATSAYKITKPYNTFYDYVSALGTIQTTEERDITTQYNALTAKASVGTLTADDAAAVKKLQDAVAAFVAEYKTSPISAAAEIEIEKIATEVAKLVAAEEEAAKWTDKDVKAAMYDAAKTTSYTKPSKTSVKLTAKADMTEIKENGYTVKYRFYQKGPKKTSYKLWKTSTSGAYTFKGLKKGTHSFKVKVSVYNAEGKLVAYKYTNVRTLKIK